MPPPLKAKAKILASKIEGIYANDSLPDATINGVPVYNLDLTPLETESVPRDFMKSTFGNDEDYISAAYAKLSFETDIVGSGTAGTPPPVGNLLRACSMSETILTTANTASAVSGGVNTIGLGATASAVTDAYVGMTINITAGIGNGQSGVIKSYDGATKVATMMENWTTPPTNASTYSLNAQVIYRRITDNPESITHYAYFGSGSNAVLHKVVGARGNVSLQLDNKKLPKFKFSYLCIYVPVVDQAAPAIDFAASKKPVIVNAKNTRNIKLLGYSGVALSSLTIDLGNETQYRTMPGASDCVTISDSKPTGSINQRAVKVADKNWFDSVLNIEVGGLSVTHGLEAGNIFKVDAPRTQVNKIAYADEEGDLMINCGLKFLPSRLNTDTIFCFM
jgi:hypothetical protein